MRLNLLILIVFILGFSAGACIFYIMNGTETQITGCAFEPYFAPSSDGRLIEMIDSARESVYIEMYVMTNDDIMDAIARAEERGVDTRVLLDKTIDSNKDAFSALAGSGVDVKWTSEHFTLTHAKMLIVDRKTLFIGSSNFSHNAFYKNRETNVIISGCDISAYTNTFEEDWNSAG